MCERETMATKSETGKLGENLACKYLVDKRYKIIDRNYRKPWGELDIIARAPDKTLVFVEVKTVVSYNVNSFMNNSDLLGCRHSEEETPNNVDNLLVTPEEQLTSAKANKLRKIASWYARDNQEMISEKRGWRIDLLALTISQKNCLVKHYENVV